MSTTHPEANNPISETQYVARRPYGDPMGGFDAQREVGLTPDQADQLEEIFIVHQLFYSSKSPLHPKTSYPEARNYIKIRDELLKCGNLISYVGLNLRKISYEKHPLLLQLFVTGVGVLAAFATQYEIRTAYEHSQLIMPRLLDIAPAAVPDLSKIDLTRMGSVGDFLTGRFNPAEAFSLVLSEQNLRLARATDAVQRQVNLTIDHSKGALQSGTVLLATLMDPIKRVQQVGRFIGKGLSPTV